MKTPEEETENAPAPTASATPPAASKRRRRLGRKSTLTATGQINEAMTLKQLRQALGISQVVLAAKLGMNQGTVCAFELRESHTTDALREYLSGLDLEFEIVVKVQGRTVRLAGV